MQEKKVEKRVALGKMVAFSLVVLFMVSGFSAIVYGSISIGHGPLGAQEAENHGTFGELSIKGNSEGSHGKMSNAVKGNLLENMKTFSGNNSKTGSLVNKKKPEANYDGTIMNTSSFNQIIDSSGKLTWYQQEISGMKSINGSQVSPNSQYKVSFFETGLPENYEWKVTILNSTQGSSVYLGNYTSTGNSIYVYLPGGVFEYEVFGVSNLYLTHNAAGLLNLTGSNSSTVVNITFYEDPASIQYQYYVNMPPHSSRIFYLPSFTGNASLSLGVMNGTLNVSIYKAGSLMYSQNISGGPTNYDAFEPSDKGYDYANFYSSGNESIVVYNPGSSVALFAYNFWNGFINNYTASLITIPPQFADNLNTVSQNSYSAYEPNILNKGLSLSVVAPYYRYQTPIAVWVGEGYIYPNNTYWWVQLGYFNWYSSDIISYPFYESFSNIPGVPSIQVVDYNLPLVPNQSYNFTMKLINNTTWGFYDNGDLIEGSGYPGTMNTTTGYAFYNKDFGFETLTEQRAEVSRSACIPDNNLKILRVESFLVNGTWINAENFSMNNIGENWWNGNTSSAMGMDLWSIQGNLQNKSIPPGEIIFENNGEPLFNIPSYSNDSGYPVFGNFSYPYANVSSNGVLVKVSEGTNGSIYVIPRYNEVLVSLLQFKNDTSLLQNFTNFIVTGPSYLKNPYYHTKEAMAVALENNTLWAYGGKFQEIVLTRFQEYNITFTESGLPAGTEWYVNLYNGQSYQSTANFISFSEPNGSYPYTVSSVNRVYAPAQYAGSFTVDGAPVSVSVTFSPVTYSITFTESGLHQGSMWYVTLNGTTENSTSSEMTFQEPNGTYSFHVLPPSGTSASPMYGTITVAGSNVNETIYFSFALPRAYTLTFSEIGLSPGTSWSVTLNGTTISSTNSMITFQEPNGTYSFSIMNILGYNAIPSAGSIAVNGKPSEESISFARIAQMGYFVGSISPSNATISINGTFYQAVNGQFNISLSPGTYEVKVSAPGYSTYTTDITISSSSVSKLPIQSLAKVTTHSSLSFLLIVVIVVIAAIVAVAVVAMTRSRRKRF